MIFIKDIILAILFIITVFYLGKLVYNDYKEMNS